MSKEASALQEYSPELKKPSEIFFSKKKNYNADNEKIKKMHCSDLHNNLANMFYRKSEVPLTLRGGQ